MKLLEIRQLQGINMYWEKSNKHLKKCLYYHQVNKDG